MSREQILIAELSNALIEFQKAEDVSNLFMIAVLEECTQIWKRKELLKELNKGEGNVRTEEERSPGSIQS